MTSTPTVCPKELNACPFCGANPDKRNPDYLWECGANLCCGNPVQSPKCEIACLKAQLAPFRPFMDETEVTEDWLLSIGFKEDRMGCPTIGPLHIHPVDRRGVPAYACIRSFPIPIPKTRGVVMNLLHVLGIKVPV